MNGFAKKINFSFIMDDFFLKIHINFRRNSIKKVNMDAEEFCTLIKLVY